MANEKQTVMSNKVDNGIWMEFPDPDGATGLYLDGGIVYKPENPGKPIRVRQEHFEAALAAGWRKAS